MSTRNRLDLTQHSAQRQLDSLIQDGDSFIVQTMHADGYLINAYSVKLERMKGRNLSHWFGYKRVAGKLRKFYIARCTDLSVERLKMAVVKLQVHSTE